MKKFLGYFTSVEAAAKKGVKTSLSKAGMLGIGAAGLFAFLAISRRDKKDKIAPRRREGKVHEHPRTDTFGRAATAGGMMLAGGIGAGIAFASKKYSPGMASLMAAGAAVGAGLGLSALYKDDQSVGMLGVAGAGAAAAAAYAFVSKNNGIGLQSLKSFLSKHGAKATVDGASQAVVSAQKNFPLLSRFLSTEGQAIGAGLVTIPMAHSLMVKHFAAEKRKTTDNAGMAILSSIQDNKAGSKGFRKSNAPLFAPNTSNIADVNFTGSVNSYYNTEQIFGSL